MEANAATSTLRHIAAERFIPQSVPHSRPLTGAFRIQYAFNKNEMDTESNLSYDNEKGITAVSACTLSSCEQSSHDPSGLESDVAEQAAVGHVEQATRRGQPKVSHERTQSKGCQGVSCIRS